MLFYYQFLIPQGHCHIKETAYHGICLINIMYHCQKALIINDLLNTILIMKYPTAQLTTMKIKTYAVSTLELKQTLLPNK